MNLKYDALTGTQKTQWLIGNDIYAFYHSDPECVIDFQGMASPSTMNNAMEIVNSSTNTLWFKIEGSITVGDPGQWTNLTLNLGSLNPATNGILWWTPSRINPSTLTIETMQVWIKAFSDSGYSIPFGQDYVDYTYYFFDHSWVSLTTIDESDFESTFDGWSYNLLAFRSSIRSYKGAFSILCYTSAFNQTMDSSGQYIPSQTYYFTKTFNTAGYSKAFFIFHCTYHLRPGSLSAFRIWNFDSKDYIIRTNQTASTFQPWRIAVPLPIAASVAVRFVPGLSNTHECYLDDFIVIGVP